MLEKYSYKINSFLLNLFKIKSISFFYIKYIYLVYKYFINIYKNIYMSNVYKNKYNSQITFIFKKLKFNKKTYYNNLIFKNITLMAYIPLTLKSYNQNMYLVQKNFFFYYKLLFVNYKHFAITLNIQKTLYVILSLKIILFNLFFYNIKVLVWGTPDFSDEIHQSNELFNLKNFNLLNIKYFVNSNLFTSDVTYNLKVYFFFKFFSKILKRNIVFISLQNTGNSLFVIQRFKYFSFGCLTNIKLKHSYGFLIPIHIRYNFSKFFIYSFILSYKNIAIKYQLVFSILYFFRYRLLINFN